jgi:hypothetical protein
MPIPQHSKVKDESKFWKILLYADSGAGKTVYALKDKRVLVLAIGAENEGLMSAARMGVEAEKIVAKTWDELILHNNDLWSDEGVEWLAENFDVLVIDSLTEADSQCMLYILRKTREQKLAKDTDPDQPWIDDYGTRNRLLEKLVRSLNDLPINVFWTSLPRTAEDPDGKEFMVPMLGGNKATDFRFSMKLAALMTSFGYMRVETLQVPAPTEEKPEATRKVKQRVIYWEDTSFSKGKDRTIALAPKTINFTMQHMRLCIAGKIDNTGKKIVTESVENPTPAKKAPAKKAAQQASPPPVKAVASAPETKPEPKAATPAAPEPKENVDNDAGIDLVSVEP